VLLLWEQQQQTKQLRWGRRPLLELVQAAQEALQLQE
jgi:hypothetical protein